MKTTVKVVCFILLLIGVFYAGSLRKSEPKAHVRPAHYMQAQFGTPDGGTATVVIPIPNLPGFGALVFGAPNGAVVQ